MKNSYLLLFCILLTSATFAQQEQTSKTAGLANDVGLNISVPVGDFASTHRFGVGANYSWSNHRFGCMQQKPSPLGVTINAGGDYYFGKTETIPNVPAPNTYKNQGYLFVHTYIGVMYNPCTKGNISLTGGPALSFFGGHTYFNYGAILSGTFYLKKSMYGISPYVSLIKHADVDGLYVLGFRGSYAF